MLTKKSTPTENNEQPTIREKMLTRFYSQINKKNYDYSSEQATDVENTFPFNFGRPSILEMWNLIESIGVNRQTLDKIFTTDEAVAELYNVIEKRIHYNREQEMIRRLTVYSEKIT